MNTLAVSKTIKVIIALLLSVAGLSWILAGQAWIADLGIHSVFFKLAYIAFIIAPSIGICFFLFLGIQKSKESKEVLAKFYLNRFSIFSSLLVFLFFIVFQITYLFLTNTSYNMMQNNLHPALHNIAIKNESVDLTNQIEMNKQKLYADFVFFKYGEIHSVTTLSGEPLEFLPTAEQFTLREELQDLRASYIDLRDTVILGIIFNLLILCSSIVTGVVFRQSS